MQYEKIKRNRANKVASIVLDVGQKKAQKKKLLILCVVGVFAIAAVVASATLYSMSIKYEQAIFLLDCNRINEAAALFEELGEYKDSAEQFAALMEKSTSNIQD